MSYVLSSFKKLFAFYVCILQVVVVVTIQQFI